MTSEQGAEGTLEGLPSSNRCDADAAGATIRCERTGSRRGLSSRGALVALLMPALCRK